MSEALGRVNLVCVTVKALERGGFACGGKARRCADGLECVVEAHGGAVCRRVGNWSGRAARPSGAGGLEFCYV